MTSQPVHCCDCGKPLSSSAKQDDSKRCKSCAQKGKLNHRWKGGKPCCQTCGKKLKDWRGQFCLKCAKIGEKNPRFGFHKTGKDAPNWQGGKTKELYSDLFTDKLKEKIRKRDNYICQICNRTEKENKRKLHVHHIDYNKKNCEEKNLVSLCSCCHVHTNAQRNIWRKIFTQKPKIVFTSGVFDLCHIGHLRLLQKAKNLGTYLIVGISTNALVKKYKKIKPVISWKDRAAVIKAFKCVDKIVKQEELISIKQFKATHADLFVIGSDWKKRYDNKGLNWLRKNNKVIFLPYTKELSSSIIKEKIIAQAIPIIRAQSKRNK